MYIFKKNNIYIDDVDREDVCQMQLTKETVATFESAIDQQV